MQDIFDQNNCLARNLLDPILFWYLLRGKGTFNYIQNQPLKIVCDSNFERSEQMFKYPVNALKIIFKSC